MNERNNHRRIDRTEEIARVERRRPRKSSKALYYVILLILVGILVFSAVKIISYFRQQSASEDLQQGFEDQFIIPASETDATDTDASEGDGEKPKESAKPYVPEKDWIDVNFDAMIEKYPDVIGFIYAANTGIKYPIVHGQGNNYYLTHTYDGSSNNNGTIFMEDLNATSFTNSNTIIYGHNMKSGAMFAALCNYKNQSYYDAHPYMYIYTPSQNYRLDLFAGYVCNHDDEVYSLSLSSSQLSAMAAKSTFKSNIGVPTGNVVTLSTCSYEHDNARYVVMGELVPVDNPG